MKENDRIGNRTEYLLARLPIGKVSQEIESLLHVVAKIYTHGSCLRVRFSTAGIFE